MFKKPRIAILISGRGSNMSKLIQKIQDGFIPVNLVCIVSNKTDAYGIKNAHQNKIKTYTTHPQNKKENLDTEIDTILKKENIDIVCCAGFMHIFGISFTSKWCNKILNIHPSLLPSFPGLNTHKRAIEEKVCFSGCTVHIITKNVDRGQILAQAVVPIFYKDSEELLSQKILAAEHVIYPLALKKFVLQGITEERTFKLIQNKNPHFEYYISY